MLDAADGNKSRLFILECVVSKGEQHNIEINKVDTDTDSSSNTETILNPFLKSIKQIVDATCAVLTSKSSDSSSQLSLMEEGSLQHSHSSSSSASESMTDKLTVSASQAVGASSEAISESFDKDKVPANDRFLGESFATSHQWNGRNVQFFKPNNLNLFELALLAHVVHEQYPTYSMLRNHCYFYASLVYDAAEALGGIRPSQNADITGNDVVYNIDSHLTQRYGRWNGLKVGRMDPKEVSNMVAKFKYILPKQLESVILIFMFI
jgi:hypothetical protein